MDTPLISSVISTHTGDLEVFYRLKGETTTIKKLFVDSTDFFLPKVWVNDQPATSLEGFKFKKIEEESLVSFYIEENQLHLRFKPSVELSLKVIFEGKLYLAIVHPNLKVSGLRAYLLKVHGINLDTYHFKKGSFILEDRYKMHECFLKYNQRVFTEKVRNDYLYFDEQKRGKGDLEFGSFPFNLLKNEVLIYFSNDAPSYRTVYSGLNLEGKCQNIGCEALRNKVVYHVKEFGEFHISEWRLKAKCPKCKTALMKVTNCIFLDCIFSIIGDKKDGAKFKPIERRYAPLYCGVSYRELNPEDIIKWDNLILTVEPINRTCVLF